jgi:hypothetical protein
MAKKKISTAKVERCRLLHIDCRVAAANLVGDLGTYNSVQDALDKLNADPDVFADDQMIIVTESLRVIEVLSRDIVHFYISNPPEKKTEEKNNG